MKTIRKILVVGSQALFAGWILLFTFFIATGGGDIPDKRWFEKLPVCVLLLINIVSLLVVGFIIWVIIQLFV
jgi:hypothetical protein